MRVTIDVDYSHDLGVNKFIATNTRLCDIFSLEALMDYANVLGYSNYYEYTLDELFSKAIQ